VDFGESQNHLAFRFLFFEPSNRGLELLPQLQFQFFLRAGPVERINGLSPFVEGNVTAREFLPLHVLRYDLREDALTARSRLAGGIEVQTRRRILKRKVRTPRSSLRVAVPAFLQELQFVPTIRTAKRSRLSTVMLDFPSTTLS